MAKNLIALESVVLQLNSNWALAKSSRGGTKEWLAPRSFEVESLKNKHSRGDFGRFYGVLRENRDIRIKGSLQCNMEKGLF